MAGSGVRRGEGAAVTRGALLRGAAPAAAGAALAACAGAAGRGQRHGRRRGRGPGDADPVGPQGGALPLVHGPVAAHVLRPARRTSRWTTWPRGRPTRTSSSRRRRGHAAGRADVQRAPAAESLREQAGGAPGQRTSGRRSWTRTTSCKASTRASAKAGRQFAIPQFVNVNFMFYNRTAFQRAGVPFPRDDWTHDQFLETARRLTQGPLAGAGDVGRRQRLQRGDGAGRLAAVGAVRAVHRPQGRHASSPGARRRTPGPSSGCTTSPGACAWPRSTTPSGAGCRWWTRSSPRATSR